MQKEQMTGQGWDEEEEGFHCGAAGEERFHRDKTRDGEAVLPPWADIIAGAMMRENASACSARSRRNDLDAKNANDSVADGEEFKVRGEFRTAVKQRQEC
jgi:hypothetical protein